MIGEGLEKNPIYDILRGGPLWLDPESELQFLNTDEVAKNTFQLIDKGLKNEIFNLCGDGLIKLKSLFEKFSQIPVQPNSPNVKYNVNIEKIKKHVKISSSEQSVLNFIEPKNTN